MVAGKALYQHSGERILAAHKDVFPRYEHILQDGETLAANHAIAGVALINLAFQFPVVIGLTAEDMDDAGGIQRAADGVVFIFLAVAGGGHDEHFVGVNHAGHVGLGAPDVNALVVLLHYVDEQVGVGLLRGA